jgi:cytochrome c peroxidase
MFGLLSDPVLVALRDPTHPMHQTLIDQPFYTVPIKTQAQERGKRVFRQYCMGCHNTPNVFNNLSNIEPQGNGARDVDFLPFPPSLARTFDIGVAQQNKHGLRFTYHEGDGTFSPIVIPLVANDRTVVQHTVTFDIGLAATTARVEDIGRFKVPQLRGVRDNGPYFHNNSAATLEEVVDYFNSDAYNKSRDGQRFPIDLSAQERTDLLAFLDIL